MACVSLGAHRQGVLEIEELHASHSAQERTEYRRALKQKNCHSYHDLFVKKPWDLEYFQEQHVPVIIGKLSNPAEFSRPQEQGMHYVDMPIFMPGQGWRIPKELIQFSELIARVIEAEKEVNPDFEKDQYVYISADQCWVPAGIPQREAGWHGDSFRKINTYERTVRLGTDHAYIITDMCPTVFVAGPCPLEGIDVENINEVIEKLGEYAASQEKIFYEPYHIIRMNPYCIHHAGINDCEEPVFRTFVRINISPAKYCRIENSHNYLFNYTWMSSPSRETSYAHHVVPGKKAQDAARDEYSDIHAGTERYGAIAQLVEQGSTIELNIDGFVTVVLIARKGDVKITLPGGTSFFVNAQQYKDIPHDWYMIARQKNALSSSDNEHPRGIELMQDIILPLGEGVCVAHAGDTFPLIND